MVPGLFKIISFLLLANSIVSQNSPSGYELYTYLNDDSDIEIFDYTQIGTYTTSNYTTYLYSVTSLQWLDGKIIKLISRIYF